MKLSTHILKQTKAHIETRFLNIYINQGEVIKLKINFMASLTITLNSNLFEYGQRPQQDDDVIQEQILWITKE